MFLPLMSEGRPVTQAPFAYPQFFARDGRFLRTMPPGLSPKPYSQIPTAINPRM